MIHFEISYKKYHRSIINLIEVCKRLRVYTLHNKKAVTAD
jgi:hypothetical protein